MWSVAQLYPASRTSPAAARNFCACHLDRVLTGTNADAVSHASHAAQVIVSELMTNSVNAGSSQIGLRISITGPRLVVAVDDDAPGDPALSRSQPHDERGRGLLIVQRLAEAWGTLPAPGGKRTWAEIRLPNEPEALAASSPVC